MMAGGFGGGAAETQRSLARSVGKAACVYGYPLVELMRMCRLQTMSRFDAIPSGRAPVDTLHHSDHPPTDRGGERAGGLYTTAWIYLGDGPRHLHLPAGWLHPGHRLRARLYNAHTEKIAEFGPDALVCSGADVLLLGPSADVPEARDGRTAVRASTDMVWLVVRVDGNDDDREGADALRAEIVLDAPEGTLKKRRPPAVDLWEGDDSDAIVDLLERGESASSVAPIFYSNLCRALAHARARPEDRRLVASFRLVGLEPGASLHWGSLMPALRMGLVEGFEDAAEYLCMGTIDRERQAIVDSTMRLEILNDRVAPYFASARNASLMPSLTSTSFGSAFRAMAASLSL